MLNFQTEQEIRSSVDEQLKNLGWVFAGVDKNVFQEQPRDDEQRKKLKGKRPDYVLYSSQEKYREEPLIIIETKKPGVSLDGALAQGNSYARELNAPITFATDGIYYKTLHTKLQKPLYLNGDEIDELIRELEALKFLREDTNQLNTISRDVLYSRKELIKTFEEANDLLRDEGLRAGIERFGEFSNILFLKLLGEIEDLKEEENSQFLIGRDFRWSYWKDKNGEELLHFVNDTVLKEMGRVYSDFDIFTPLAIKNPTTLRKIIDKLEPLKLVNIDSDIKGDSFEYFLKQSTSTKNDLGEYFTPRHIVKTMVKLINPQFGEKIYDPFCGTGGMLIESFKHIYSSMPRNPRNVEILKNEMIFGNEITSTARITKMNMILIGDGHSGIHQKNSLKNPIEDQYDAVITNMPYSQKTEYGAFYDLPSNNGDSICIQHCIKAINKASENGRIAVVVPEGFLFRKDMQKTREYLLDRCNLKSIISLPQGVFLPYTGVKTNILYCTDIKKNKKQEKIWYFEVKNDGYSLDSHRKKLDEESDLQKFLEYRNSDAQEKKDMLRVGFYEIDLEEVKKNDLVLSGNRYKKIINFSINNDWKIIKLSEVAEIIMGQSPEGKYYNQKKEGLPFYQGKSGFGETYLNKPETWTTQTTKISEEEDVLMSVRAPVGSVNISPFKLCIGRGLCAIRPQLDKLNNIFLFYYLKNIEKQIVQLSTGSTFGAISKQDVENVTIPLPTIEKQLEIVEELTRYQNVIDGAKKVLQNWRPQIEIDPKWRLVKIGDCCRMMTGGTPRSTEKKYYQNGTINWLVSGDIHKGEIFDCKGKITEEGMKNSNAKWLPINSVLIALNGQGKTRGTVALLRTKATCNQSIVAIFVKEDNILLPEFLYYQLKNRYQELRDITGDKQRSGLNMPIIRSINISIPSIIVQKDIVSKIEEEQKWVVSNEQIINKFEYEIKRMFDSFFEKYN